MNDEERREAARREAAARLTGLIQDYDLTRCPVCGEYRNPEHNILCICDGERCRTCGRVKSHKVHSRSVNEADGRLWWSSYVVGWKPCPYCHPEHYERLRERERCEASRMTDEDQRAWASGEGTGGEEEDA